MAAYKGRLCTRMLVYTKEILCEGIEVLLNAPLEAYYGFNAPHKLAHQPE